MAAIDVQNLTKAYGETVANDHLEFSIERGEIFGYLGPNGAGKSTTIRQLLGFQSPTEGTATIYGTDVRDADALREVKTRVGFLPGELEFDRSVTGREFLDYQAALKGDDRREDLLELFTPPLDRKIREYSTGNKQMLGLVQAFMHDPDLVIMDEPTSGLDPLKQEAFYGFLREERDQGKTVFFSSHVLGEVRRVCDRVGIIRDVRARIETEEPFSSESPTAYVDRLDPGESTTLAFAVTTSDDAVPTQSSVTLNIEADRPDGETIDAGTYVVPVSVVASSGPGNTTLLAAGIIIVALVFAGGWWWLRQ